MIHFYFWSLTLTINFSFRCINCDILSFESNIVQLKDSTIFTNYEKFDNRIEYMSYFSVIVGMQDATLASLSDTHTQVTLTIEESNDPYGRFAFTFSSREVIIAEDYYPGEDNKTVAKLKVERRNGGFGNVQVMH